MRNVNQELKINLIIFYFFFFSSSKEIIGNKKIRIKFSSKQKQTHKQAQEPFTKLTTHKRIHIKLVKHYSNILFCK